MGRRASHRGKSLPQPRVCPKAQAEEKSQATGCDQTSDAAPRTEGLLTVEGFAQNLPMARSPNTGDTYDALVVGLGAIGSAALYQLSRRGARVLGLDQFSPPHSRGSSHGDTRITRLAIGEGRHYVPLALRSHEIWRELEASTGESLLTLTGGMFFASSQDGSPAHGAADFIGETLAAAEHWGIEHEKLPAEAIGQRYPQFKLHGSERGYWERDAGFVRPERCIAAQLASARHHGAEIACDTRVESIERDADSTLRVESRTHTYRARRVILSAGPWVKRFLPAATRTSFAVYRQLLFWFEVEGSIADFEPPRFPVFIRTAAKREDLIYGFPAVDGPRGGIKIASEQYQETWDPEIPLRPPTEEETQGMYERALPALRIGRRCLRSTACLFTVTLDGEFVIDQHPECPGLWVASPCSGHGFKHSAAVGEMLAELALEGRSRFDPEPFRLARFQRG